ncbi:MAG: tetratricopeptide repeat protein [Planctomycetes bacterium]|nr:tetratricopeptide repeat protein [Planctomycetota bacterium]
MIRGSRLGMLAFVMLFAGMDVFAQDTDVIRATGGRTEVRGEITKEDFKEIEIKTSSGIQKIPWKDVINVVYKQTPASYREGERQFQTRHYSQAFDEYKKAVEESGKGGRELFKQHALHKLATCALLTRKYEEAISTFRSLLTSVPETKYVRECHVGIVRAYLDKGDPAGAAPALESARNTGKSSNLGDEFDGYMELFKARILEGTGKQAEASGSLTALAASARSPAVQGEAAIARGRVLEKLGQEPDALKVFRDALAGAPSSSARAAAGGYLAQMLAKQAEAKKDQALLREAAFACAQGVALCFPDANEPSDGYELALYQAGMVYEALVAATPKKDGKDVGAEEFGPKATAALKELAERFPDSPWTQKLRERRR